MLNILYGRAGTGKTRQIMEEIKQKAGKGNTGILLIVPEQYSHYAERQLCKICGDSMSLYAEVLTFTRLCSYVFDETGGAANGFLDKSGQILVLQKAMESVIPKLKIFTARKTHTEILKSLLSAINEFKSMCIDAKKLEEMAEITESPLSEKLHDLAIIMGAYEALTETYGADTHDRLTLLASKISGSSLTGCTHIYFDGFNDFTAQEMRVIEQLIQCKTEITVCITCEPETEIIDPGYADIFEIPRRTISRLCNISGAVVQLIPISSKSMKDRDARRQELIYLEQHLFDDIPAKYPYSDPASTDSSKPPVTIIEASSPFAECEQAAAIIIELINTGNYRWRDIAIMARDFSEYESVCDYVFNKYRIPYFTSGKADIINKPPIALIDAALSIVTMGFEYKSVGKYLKTGLPGVEPDDVALLENYILMWNIRGSSWLNRWKMSPYGYRTGELTPSKQENIDKTLKRLNDLRHKIVQPLMKLKECISKQASASTQLNALYEFITDIELPQRLREKAESFAMQGELRLSSEYEQMTDIIIDALDQMHTVLGDSKLTATEFHKLVMLVLSEHSVGVIPISIDTVPAGSIAMSRRRDIKCLIILGATDANLPGITPGTGLLSDNERKALSGIDKDIPSGLEERIYREMNMLYSTITLPSDKLIMIYNTTGNNRPTYLIERLCRIFDISVEREYTITGGSDTVDAPAYTPRMPVSASTAMKLYGKDLRLSATGVNRYYSCPYKHFLYSGLKLEPRHIAEFSAAEAGSFAHYILENIINEIIKSTGIGNADNEQIDKLVTKYTEQYVSDVLKNFDGKDERFIYLFRRYENSVIYTAYDMVEELKSSKFEPVDFELNLKELQCNDNGIIDRVDAYSNDGKLYLRVIDYKTRKRAYKFNLSDILSGRDMQMLIYLFALENNGEVKYGRKPVPAGVLYVPARDVIINVHRNATEEEIEKERTKEMRRSGLVLKHPEIIEAMEINKDKRFIPDKEDTYVTDKQLSQLSKYVGNMMSKAKKNILSGDNTCKPYYKDPFDNACTYCEYAAVCKFDELLGDRHLYTGKNTVEEVWKKIEDSTYE